MRRTIAILFLALFTFNLVGYYGIYVGLKIQAHHEMLRNLDAGLYDETQVHTLKIPLTLPYQTDWQTYQRVDGDFEWKGEFYNLVSQKLERDTLIVHYIKDHKEASLFESFTEIVQTTTDTPISKKAGKLAEAFAKDYMPSASNLEIASTGWLKQSVFTRYAFALLTHAVSVQYPPPRAIV